MAGIEDFRAKDLMSKDLISARVGDTVSEAIGLMKRHNVSELLIKDDRGNDRGLVTDETFVKRRHLPLSTKLENVMQKPPHVDESESIVEICEMLLSSGFRGIPVTSKKGAYVGFVSRTDVTNAIPMIDDLKKMEVSEVMTPSPTTVRSNESIGKAKALMRELDERVLPVVDEYGNLKGMIGLIDIVNETFKPQDRESMGERSGEKESPAKDIKIGSIMIENPITIHPKDYLHEAAKKMSKYDISTLVAIDDSKIKGILTQIDLVETIASFRESDQVYVQITGVEEGPDTLDIMYDMIQKYLNKFANVIKPLVLNIHVVTHQSQGEETKYSIRLRLQSDQGMYYTKQHDWNMMKALDEGLENMRRKIFQDKEKMKNKMRGHPKYMG